LIKKFPLDIKAAEAIVNLSFKEDIGNGDITTNSIFDKSVRCSAIIKSKDHGILAGNAISELVFKKLDKRINYIHKKKDGQTLKPNDVIAELSGPVRAILSGERMSLNFLQRLSGIATLASKYSEIAMNYNVKILDTRKTTPGIRVLQKYAVTVGGCYNHRFGLFDGILIKDNHIKIAGSIKNAVDNVRNKYDNIEIEVEASSLKQVREALRAGSDVIMLDNMQHDKICKAVRIINGKAKTEASGSINLTNLKKYAKTGVDYISVGALTHSSNSLDIGLYVLR
jgi:nicotinate-nucleotide pyrophosphorylase (carboxylating)